MTAILAVLATLLLITGCTTPEELAMQALKNSPMISVNAVLKTELTADGQSQPDTDIIATSWITVRSGAQAQCMVGEEFIIAVPENKELTEQTGDSGVIFSVEPKMVDDTIFLKGDVQILDPPQKQKVGQQQVAASFQETILVRFSTKIESSENAVELAPVTLKDGTKLTVSIHAKETSPSELQEELHQLKTAAQSPGTIPLTVIDENN